MTLGQFLEMRRVHLRLTQQEVADRIGCTNGTISQQENSIRTPSVATLHAFAQALDVAPAVLFVLVQVRCESVPQVSDDRSSRHVCRENQKACITAPRPSGGYQCQGIRPLDPM